MPEFEDLWNFIVTRSAQAAIPIVQEKTELEYIFNLMKECKSYLEIGTAEGNSLYVLANGMPKGSEITYIDWAEPHTDDHRNFILDRLKDYKITPIHGDTNDFKTRDNIMFNYDMVLIDAGHDAFSVAIDALFYGPLARKYIVFHDIQLPEVNRAYEWFCRQHPRYKNYRVVNSPSYGFGIIECTQ